MMRRARTVPTLEWSDGLAQAARDHCQDQSTHGFTSAIGSDGSSYFARQARYGQVRGPQAENMTFGKNNGSEYIYQLYINDGNSHRNDRKKIMNAQFKKTGIAYCPHPLSQGMIVIVYASEFLPKCF